VLSYRTQLLIINLRSKLDREKFKSPIATYFQIDKVSLEQCKTTVERSTKKIIEVIHRIKIDQTQNHHLSPK
jgi:hypothetical protein